MQIETVGGVVQVTFPGNLDEDVAVAVESAVTARLVPTVTAVLFDASEVEDTTIFARTTLIRLQAVIGQGRRTSWLAARPRIRGFCQWICHVAEDPLAKVHMTREQAELWLTDSSRRFEAIQKRTADAIAAAKNGGAA